jgi:hypothetical protein
MKPKTEWYDTFWRCTDLECPSSFRCYRFIGDNLYKEDLKLDFKRKIGDNACSSYWDFFGYVATQHRKVARRHRWLFMREWDQKKEWLENKKKELGIK